MIIHDKQGLNQHGLTLSSKLSTPLVVAHENVAFTSPNNLVCKGTGPSIKVDVVDMSQFKQFGLMNTRFSKSTTPTAHKSGFMRSV